MNMDAIVLVLITVIGAATPLLFAALGELVVERAGVLNLGVEGMMLAGAVAAFAVTVTTGSATLGIITAAIAGAVMALAFASVGSDLSAQFQPPGSLGALEPGNLAKPRAKPPFDLTGTWLHGGQSERFDPQAGFKLTPEAQKHYDAGAKALAGSSHAGRMARRQNSTVSSGTATSSRSNTAGIRRFTRKPPPAAC